MLNFVPAKQEWPARPCQARLTLGTHEPCDISSRNDRILPIRRGAVSSRWATRASWGWGCRACSRRGRGGTRRPAPGRARSVIVILLSGGLGQHDSFDMKPEAPDGIRGEFKPIDTAVPGIRICEHLPGLAARADQLAIVRSMSHPEGNHLVAVHRVLTGQPSNPRGASDLDRVASRDDFPCYAAVLDHVRHRARRHPQRRGPADSGWSRAR